MSTIRDLGVVFVLVVLAASRVVSAQIDPGIIADPISSDELERYADALELSEQQQRAMRRMFGAYMTTHATMRDGPLAKFRRDHPDFSASSSEIDTDLDALRRAVSGQRTLQQKLRSMDERFFDDLSVTLSEEQIVRLDVVRAARARARHLGGPLQRSGNPALDLDMTWLAYDLAKSLAPETRIAAESLVDTYGRTLARAARNGHDDVVEYNVRLAERLNAALSAERPADWNPRFGDFQLRATILRDEQTLLQERIAAISDRHRHLLRALLALVDGETGRPFRRQVISVLYRQVPGERGYADAQFERLLEMTELPPTIREAVEGARAEYARSIDRIDTEMMDAIDAHRRSNASHALKMSLGEADPYVYDDPQGMERALAALTRDRETANAKALDALEAIVGAFLPGQVAIERPAPAHVDGPRPGVGLQTSVSVTDGGPPTYTYRHIPRERLVSQFGSGRALPPPIRTRDLTLWTRPFDFTPDHVALMDVLHADYMDQWQALNDGGALDRLRSARRALFRATARGADAVPDESTVRALFRLERQATTAVRDLDASFFEQLAVAVGEDVLPENRRRRLEQHRSRAIVRTLRPPAPFELFVFGSARDRRGQLEERAAVDVAALVGELELDPASRAEVEPLLVEYEMSATDLFEQAFDSTLALKEQSALAMVRHMRYDDDDGYVAEDMTAPDDMEQSGVDLHDVLDELLVMNHTLRASVEQILTGTERVEFARAYKRVAWPDVYEDDDCLDPALDAALALEDLQPDQRDGIAEVALAYRAAYEALADRMIESVADWPARRQFRFERDMLNQRTRDRLSELLGPEQRRIALEEAMQVE